MNTLCAVVVIVLFVLAVVLDWKDMNNGSS